jgi:hypothetical protein
LLDDGKLFEGDLPITGPGAVHDRSHSRAP